MLWLIWPVALSGQGTLQPAAVSKDVSRTASVPLFTAGTSCVSAHMHGQQHLLSSVVHRLET